jgi:hypothetical protein
VWISQEIHVGTKSVATPHGSNFNTNFSALYLIHVASSFLKGRLGKSHAPGDCATFDIALLIFVGNVSHQVLWHVNHTHEVFFLLLSYTQHDFYLV